MHITIDWQGNMAFAGQTESGHTINIDGPPALGGENVGPRPMELIALGVGSCSAIDVMHILKKSRQNVTDCHIEIMADRADTDPKVFTDINLHFVVTGEDLSENHVARAVALSAEKYCSASIMLSASVNITHSHEIRS